jgi:hypothetical protein
MLLILNGSELEKGIYIYIYRERERELGYDAMNSDLRFHAMDWFFIIKIQMIDIIVQNDFRMNM